MNTFVTAAVTFLSPDCIVVSISESDSCLVLGLMSDIFLLFGMSRDLWTLNIEIWSVSMSSQVVGFQLLSCGVSFLRFVLSLLVKGLGLVSSLLGAGSDPQVPSTVAPELSSSQLL